MAAISTSNAFHSIFSSWGKNISSISVISAFCFLGLSFSQFIFGNNTRLDMSIANSEMGIWLLGICVLSFLTRLFMDETKYEKISTVEQNSKTLDI